MSMFSEFTDLSTDIPFISLHGNNSLYVFIIPLTFQLKLGQLASSENPHPAHPTQQNAEQKAGLNLDI